MTDLALKKVIYFNQVMKLILNRGITIGKDDKDRYVKDLREVMKLSLIAEALSKETQICASMPI